MAKFYGEIGYSMGAVESSTEPGVWTEHIEERCYRGDIVRMYNKMQDADKVNDDIILSNEISIVADPFAIRNFQSIRYINYLGVKWKVNKVSIKYPRLMLSIGGVYNGQ